VACTTPTPLPPKTTCPGSLELGRCHHHLGQLRVQGEFRHDGANLWDDKARSTWTRAQTDGQVCIPPGGCIAGGSGVACPHAR
jgi:hypothetical protein